MRGQVLFTLALLFAINTVNFYDRQVPGAVGELIKDEWKLGDRALGNIGTAFTLLYAAVGLPLGRLADRAPRKYILAAAVLLWSLFTAASAWARGYWQLYALRLGVGVGEAACAPAAASLIGDLFRAERRGKALSLFMLGLPAGIAAAYFVSGRVASDGNWRAAFLVAGIPGLVLALLALALREPARGAAEAHGSAPVQGPQRSPYRLLLSIPTLWWVIVSGALHNFTMYALGTFLVPFLQRFHGAEVRQAGDMATLILGLSGFPGLIIGGLAADAVRRRGPSGRLLIAFAALLVSVPAVYFALQRPAGDRVGFTTLMACGCGLMYVYYSTVYATIQDVVEPRLRGTAMALYFFAMYFLGAALGPWATGWLSDTLTREAAAVAGVTQFTPESLRPFSAAGLHGALHVIPVLGVCLAAVLYAGSRTVARDVDRLQERLQRHREALT